MKRFLLVGAVVAAVVPAPWLLSLADEPGERRFALIVGVKDYQGTEMSNLKYTENDAHDLAAVLRQAGYRRVVVLTQKVAFDEKNEDLFPTAANIRLHLKALLEGRRPADTVFVAFSGHGVHLKKENKLFFCPKGANLNDPKTLLALDDVYEELKQSKAGVRVLVADSCRNDPLDGKAAGDERLESVTRPLLPDPPKGVAALFSCAKGQRSFESEALKHGFFMHFLIEGLKKKANRNGEVDFLGLVKYVTDEVPEAVKDEKGARYRQIPEPFLAIQGNITLAKIAGNLFGYWEADGLWYPAKVEQRDGERIQLHWHDGTTNWVNATHVCRVVLEVGDRVGATWKNQGGYYPAVIDGLDRGLIRIKYDDGTIEDTTIGSIRMNLDVGALKRVGCRVMAYWKADGNWYPGSITAVKDELYQVTYADGAQAWLPAHQVSTAIVAPGDPVGFKRKNGPNYYRGLVVSRTAKSIVVRTDDGTREETTIDMIRVNIKRKTGEPLGLPAR